MRFCVLLLLHFFVLSASSALACDKLISPFQLLKNKGIIRQSLDLRRDQRFFDMIDMSPDRFMLYDIDRDGKITVTEMNDFAAGYYQRCGITEKVM